MKLTGTGLLLLAAFAAGVFAGVWWLMIGPIVGVIAWSAVARRTGTRYGWQAGEYRRHRGVRWTSRN